MDEVAAAIADPVRRRILELLDGQRRTAGEIAQRFDISRPAISRHLRVLRDSGLVRAELVGRERYYALHKEPLAEITAWISGLGRATWERRLDALDTEVYRTRRERRGTAEPHTAKENTA
ncbi:metalloregulator ArsR/SmtB family transcription factor [Nocardia sp. NPDC050712]|uniref:metalloregulator ArsR/SmtB family transcription factor n=1 Tax=Nocardia sp. NPDC050712 TaxID=3155518 RepID=UPI0033D7DA50